MSKDHHHQAVFINITKTGLKISLNTYLKQVCRPEAQQEPFRTETVRESTTAKCYRTKLRTSAVFLAFFI